MSCARPQLHLNLRSEELVWNSLGGSTPGCLRVYNCTNNGNGYVALAHPNHRFTSLFLSTTTTASRERRVRRRRLKSTLEVDLLVAVCFWYRGLYRTPTRLGNTSETRAQQESRAGDRGRREQIYSIEVHY